MSIDHGRRNFDGGSVSSISYWPLPAALDNRQHSEPRQTSRGRRAHPPRRSGSRHPPSPPIAVVALTLESPLRTRSFAAATYESLTLTSTRSDSTSAEAQQPQGKSSNVGQGHDDHPGAVTRASARRGRHGLPRRPAYGRARREHVGRRWNRAQRAIEPLRGRIHRGSGQRLGGRDGFFRIPRTVAPGQQNADE